MKPAGDPPAVVSRLLSSTALASLDMSSPFRVRVIICCPRANCHEKFAKLPPARAAGRFDEAARA